MDDLKKLGTLMRDDWDRRLKQDYRFWMSDGHESDAVMWQSGERDFALLTRDLPASLTKVRYLDVGCGVGRLLPPALNRFDSVIGLDVSKEAIKIAGTLLPKTPSLRLIAGNGVDLEEIADAEIDVIGSFAALISVPSEVFAAYLLEFKRVLNPEGVIRMQMYLGKEQGVCKTDTLHLRCYKNDAFEEAVKRAGFIVEWKEELSLPFQVSFKDLGITAVIVSLRPSDKASESRQRVMDALLPGGEPESLDEGDVRDLECWMSLTHAQSLADQGNYEEARDALEYAISMSKSVTIDVGDALDRLQKVLADREVPAARGSSSESSGQKDYFEKNMRCLEDCFPEVAAALLALGAAEKAEVSVTETEDGPSIYFQGKSLDHASKPEAAARNWVARSLAEARIASAPSVCIYGFAAGYHVEEWVKQSDTVLRVIEPYAAVLYHACLHRDLSDLFQKLDALYLGLNGLDALDEETELLVRPQSQASAAELCDQIRGHTYGSRGIRTLKPQIGVLGPIQGGTLPMVKYVTRALLSLGQRVRPIDVSGFKAGYHEVSTLVSNDLLRKRSHGAYVQMISSVVLDSLSERPVDILICLAQNPLSADALIELRKRGIVTALWFTEDYLRFPTWKVLAPYYDYFFTIQKDACINAIKEAGCLEVHYVPVACDPQVHHHVALSAEEKDRWGSPISFVGAGYHNRQQMFASLANMPFKIWGTEWPEGKPFDRLVQEGGRRVTPEEYVRVFSSSSININLHSSTERDGVDPAGDFINPRAFELAACGAFQLVDTRAYLEDVFTPGVDVATFENARELKQKLEYYLNHEEERNAIAAKGRETVLQGHTYVDRVQQMLSIIYRRHYERLKQRMAGSPWHRILELTKQHPELQERCQIAFERGEEPGLDALVNDIVTGKGTLTETEMKLLFMYHVSKQIIRMHMGRGGEE